VTARPDPQPTALPKGHRTMPAEDPTLAPRLDPDPFAKVIYTLGELDDVPIGVAAPVKLTGPVTPPYDEIGAALDVAHRHALKTFEVKTDGRVRQVSEAVDKIASELGYRWEGHPYAGRYQPHPRVRQVERDIRFEWHLRTLILAGLPDLEVRELHQALRLPDRDPEFWRGCDDLDRRNEEASRANLSGETDGTRWEIRGPLGFHWPVFTLHATEEDGRELSGKMDLRDYVAAHLDRLRADAEAEQDPEDVAEAQASRRYYADQDATLRQRMRALSRYWHRGGAAWAGDLDRVLRGEDPLDWPTNSEGRTEGHRCGPGCGTVQTPGHPFHCGCRECAPGDVTDE
jgi:hypothetical protein